MPAIALRNIAPHPAATATPSAAGRIANFMAGASFETVEPTAADVEALQRTLPAGTRIYLTAVPGRTLDEAGAVRLRAAGFEPVPHLAVRGLASPVMLDDVLSRMAAAGVRRLMVIAGDHIAEWDLQAFAAYSRAHEPQATIALYQLPDIRLSTTRRGAFQG